MIRLAVLVEGQTEEEFFNVVLNEQLQRSRIIVQPVLLRSSKGERSRGGNVTVSRLVDHMAILVNSFDWVTSLDDFYGFRDKGPSSVEQLIDLVRSRVVKRVGKRGHRVVPYVQKHEFESLLLSDANAFSSIVPGAFPDVINGLSQVRSEFETPEDINDSKVTSPSKRIFGAMPEYKKRVHGPLIAEKTGLNKFRAECPRFDGWVKNREELN